MNIIELIFPSDLLPSNEHLQQNGEIIGDEIPESINALSKEAVVETSQSNESEIDINQSDAKLQTHFDQSGASISNLDQSEGIKLETSQITARDTTATNQSNETVQILEPSKIEVIQLNSESIITYNQSNENFSKLNQSKEGEIECSQSNTELVTISRQSEETQPINPNQSNEKECAENQIQPGPEVTTLEETKTVPAQLTPEYLTAQCIIVCQSEPECISLMSELNACFQGNESIVLQHMANGNHTKKELFEPQRILVILMSLDTFLEIKPHSIECVLFNARVNDLTMYETVQSILLRMNPLQIVQVRSPENEVSQSAF